MIDERTEESMRRVLDGEATPEETAFLRARLAADTEARATWEALQAASRALQHAGLAAAPAGWQEDVIQRLRAVTAPHARHREGFAARAGEVLAALRRRVSPRVAFAAGAACALACFAVLSVFLPASRLDPASAPGSLMPADQIRSPQSATGGALELGAARVTFRTGRSDGQTVLEIDAASETPVAIEIASLTGPLRVRGFYQVDPVGAVVRIDGERAVIEQLGRHQYRLALGEAGSGPPAFEVRLRSGGEVRAATVQTQDRAP